LHPHPFYLPSLPGLLQRVGGPGNIEPRVVMAMIRLSIIRNGRSEFAFAESGKPRFSLYHVPGGSRYELQVMNRQNLFKHACKLGTDFPHPLALPPYPSLIECLFGTPVQLHRRIAETRLLQTVREIDGPDQLSELMSIPQTSTTNRKSKVIRERNIGNRLSRHGKEHFLARMTPARRSEASRPASTMGH